MTARGEETRQLILREALVMASQVGLEGLSIGTLAREVGMSKSGLFAHFGSKAELQIAVAAHASDTFVQRVMLPAFQAPRGLPRLTALLERWRDWSQGELSGDVMPGGCVLTATAWEYDSRPGPVHDYVVHRLEELRASLRKTVAIAVLVGHLRADTDPDVLAFQLHGLLLAHQMDARAFQRANAMDLAVRAVTSLIRHHLPDDAPAS